MSADSTRVEVHPDPPTLATAVAGELLSRLVAAQVDGGVPHVCLTGGGIADQIHLEVARLGPDSEVDWDRVQLWWGDERFVERSSEDRNAGPARAAFITPLGIPEAHVHEMPATEDAPDVDAAATAYADEVRAHGAESFEIVMMGVGPDGHVASLFPGFAQTRVDDAIAVSVTGSPKPPPLRTSLTFPALNRTRSAWFLVSGESKADAVGRALSGDEPDLTRTDLPATGVHGTLDTVWFLDRAAASHL